MNFILVNIRQILERYAGKQPLSVFLKEFYKENKQLGSRDRKAISEAVYIYYRVAYLFPSDADPIEIINEGLDICHSDQKFLKIVFQKNEVAKARISAENLPDFLKKSNDDIFSKGINQENWLKELKKLPELFIRIRKNHNQVFGKLKQAEIPYQIMETGVNLGEQFTCLSIQNSSKIDQVLKASEYVVQDLSSQKAISKVITYSFSKKEDTKIWDACAGAGGKSIYLKDYEGKAYLLATDNRRQTLENLKQRFLQYGISEFNAEVLNLTHQQKVDKKLKGNQFDLILIDAPCTGSGTWKRTPEQFHFFKDEKIQEYHDLQYEIVKNAHAFLANDGVLAYITCSVFQKENEMIVERISKDFGLKCVQQKLIDGEKENADTLFLAILKK